MVSSRATIADVLSAGLPTLTTQSAWRFYRELLERPCPAPRGRFDERHRRLLTMLAWGLGSGRRCELARGFFADALARGGGPR